MKILNIKKTFNKYLNLRNIVIIISLILLILAMFFVIYLRTNMFLILHQRINGIGKIQVCGSGDVYVCIAVPKDTLQQFEKLSVNVSLYNKSEDTFNHIGGCDEPQLLIKGNGNTEFNTAHMLCSGTTMVISHWATKSHGVKTHTTYISSDDLKSGDSNINARWDEIESPYITIHK